MNQEENKAYQKEYYKTNKEKAKARYDAYYQKNKEKIRIYNKKYRAENKSKLKARSKKYTQSHKAEKQAYDRKRRLKLGYNLSVEEYDKMLVEQNGVCAICSNPPTGKPLHVDHNHKTGKVRKLLCFTCNSAIGYAKEDINLLGRMIVYLEKYR